MGYLYGLGASLQCLGVFLFIGGVLSCFFGFSLFKISLQITGFFIGAILGLGLAAIVQADVLVAVIMALVFGVLGAILAVPLHFLFTFLTGAVIGALAVYALLLVLGINPSTVLVIVGAVICGILAVVYEVGYIIISTSITGALGITLAVNFFTHLSTFLSLLFTAGLAAAGIYVQFKRLGPSAARAPLPPVICPNCGMANDAGRLNCIRCGAILSAPAAVPTPPPVSPVVATITCPNCGMANQAGHSYCKNCGHSLVGPAPRPAASAAAMVTCPSCGRENAASARFCGGCGTPLGTPAAQSGI